MKLFNGVLLARRMTNARRLMYWDAVVVEDLPGKLGVQPYIFMRRLRERQIRTNKPREHNGWRPCSCIHDKIIRTAMKYDPVRSFVHAWGVGVTAAS